MDTITIRKYSRELGDFEEYVVNLNEITMFGISLSKMKYKNGKFRKFLKAGFVQTEKKAIFFRDLDVIATLKKELKGKYTTEKRPEEIYKPMRRGYTTVRGIGWVYRIKE